MLSHLILHRSYLLHHITPPRILPTALHSTACIALFISYLYLLGKLDFNVFKDSPARRNARAPTLHA
ncbi:hypothetical protein BDQ12DRAFT_680159, partial [Crucibulum laeve]